VNVLDILLLVAAVWFAIVGYRQGFVVGILSVIGFLGGGLVAVYLLPVIWDALTDNAEVNTTVAVVAVVVVIVCASVGQALTTHLGNKLRRHITWSPARALDATGGALVNVVAMLLVAWLIGSALAGTTLPTLAKEVRGSKVLQGVSRSLPDTAAYVVKHNIDDNGKNVDGSNDYMRGFAKYRHGAQNQCNMLFADGHVQTSIMDKSTYRTDLSVRNFHVFFPLVLQ